MSLYVVLCLFDAVAMNSSELLLVHSGSNLHQVWDWMRFNSMTDNATALRRVLPPPRYIARILKPLKNATCAVVGASSKLKNCTDVRKLCRHDVIMHVNDHPAILNLCRRVDFQFVNAFACYWNEETNLFKKRFVSGKIVTADGKRLRGCEVQPRVARIRHEWNPWQIKRYASNTLLSSGLANRDAHDSLDKCCATAGGVAIAFALKACKSVVAYGVGGLNRTHIDNKQRWLSGEHNLKGELNRLRRIERQGRLALRCSG